MDERIIRRFLARMLDYMLVWLLLCVIVSQVFRYDVWLDEPAGLNTCLAYLCYPLMILTDTVQLALFGTTAGKKLMGLYPCGEKQMGWKQALIRSGRVFVSGMGCGIPILQEYCWYRGARAGDENRWQEGCSYVYRERRHYGWLFAACFAVLFLGFEGALRLAELPRHGGALTREGFVKNFADYQRFYQLNTGLVLEADGSLRRQEYVSADQTVTTYVWGEDEWEYPQIRFEEADGRLTGVTVKLDVKGKEEYPACTDLLFLLTRSFAEPGQGLVRQKEYKLALKELASDEFASFGASWGDYTLACERTAEGGMYMPSLDILFADEGGSLDYRIDFSIRKKLP